MPLSVALWPAPEITLATTLGITAEVAPPTPAEAKAATPETTSFFLISFLVAPFNSILSTFSTDTCPWLYYIIKPNQYDY